MTSTPIADSIGGNGHHARQPARPAGIGDRLTDAIATAGQAVAAAVHEAAIARELLTAAAADLAVLATPQGRRLLEALARATTAGVPDAEVEGFIAGLHGLANKAEGQRGSGPQPQFLPAPAMPAEGPQDGA